jgi:hypothetical protein
MQYWDMHKYHKCYNCGIKGHIAQDCCKVCPNCHNIHQGPFCFYLLLKYLKGLKKVLLKNQLADSSKLLRDMEVLKKKIINKELEIRGLPRDNLCISRAAEFQYKSKKVGRVEKIEFKLKMLKAESTQLESNIWQRQNFYDKIYGKILGGSSNPAAKRWDVIQDEIKEMEFRLQNTTLIGKINIHFNEPLFEESNKIILYRGKLNKELSQVEHKIKSNQKKFKNVARLNITQNQLNKKLEVMNKMQSAVETLQIEKEELERNLLYLKKEKEYIQASIKEEFKEKYLEKKNAYYQKANSKVEAIKEKYHAKVDKFYQIVQDISSALKKNKKHRRGQRRYISLEQVSDPETGQILN